MGCRILEDKNGYACFYDSVTMTAFGPVTDVETLEQFEKYLNNDPRVYTNLGLEELWIKFCKESNPS
jgi:hypothetical protein